MDGRTYTVGAFKMSFFSLPCKINVLSPKWDSSILFLSSFRCCYYCSWHVHKRLHSKTLRELMPCPNGNFSWFNVIVRMNCECIWMCVGIWLIWFSFLVLTKKRKFHFCFRCRMYICYVLFTCFLFSCFLSIEKRRKERKKKRNYVELT